MCIIYDFLYLLSFVMVHIELHSTVVMYFGSHDIDGFHGAWLHFWRARIGVCF